MSINNDPYDLSNTSALDAMRKLQENSALTAVHELQASSAVTVALKMETTGAFAAVRDLQSTFNAVKSSMGGATAALEEYRKIVAPISESIKAMNLAFAPIFGQTRTFDALTRRLSAKSSFRPKPNGTRLKRASGLLLLEF